MFKTIVVAVDGSETSGRAESMAVDMAKEGGAKLVLVNVAEHNIGKGGGDLRADEDDVRAAVRKRAEELSGEGVDAGAEFKDSSLGGPAHAIADVAKEHGADVIVLGTRGHAPVSGLLLGSVAQRLLHITPCPVLCVPPN